MAKEWCCEMMKVQCSNECDIDHGDLGCPDEVMRRFGKGKNAWFGIPIHDGGTSGIQIAFCPWCGVRVGPDVD